jgi:hypothetical protein
VVGTFLSVTFLDEVGKRRLDEAERLRHDAFVREIVSHWQPVSRRDRLLHARAQVIHAVIRLFGGGPTLWQIGVASALLATSMVLRGLAPIPHQQTYVVPVPGWARMVVVAGMLTLAFEAIRSPLHIHRRRLIAFAIAPIPIVQVWLLAQAPLHEWPTWPVRVSWTVGGIGIALLISAVRFRKPTLVRASLMVVVVGAAALTASDGVRMLAFLHDGDPLLAVASALTVFGAAIIAAGLLRSRAVLAP